MISPTSQWLTHASSGTSRIFQSLMVTILSRFIRLSNQLLLMKVIVVRWIYGLMVRRIRSGMSFYSRESRLYPKFFLMVPGDKCARVSRMMSDVLFWALDNPSEYPELLPNVMVISKNISEDKQFLWVLQILDWRDYKILLVDYDNVAVMQHDFVSSVWLWTSLLEGRKPIDQSVDSKLKGTERTTATCSGSSEGVANKRGRKKRKSKKPHEAKSGAESTANAGSED